MKIRSTATKLVVLSLVLVFASTAAFAEAPIDFGAIEPAFEAFAEGVAGALPLNAAVGLNWSHAYIGHFPRFGVGLTAGITTIPYGPVEEAFGMLGVEMGELAEFADLGVPFPAYTIDARLGGFILPFDVGVKFGVFDEATGEALSASLPDNIDLEYMLVGFDVRYNLLRETFITPAISVGAGFNRLNGTVRVKGLLGEQTELANFTDPLGGQHFLALSDPAVSFNWGSSVIDFKAQASKNVLYFLTPYIGVGASRGLSTAGGGLAAKLLYSEDGTPASYEPITPEQFEQLKTAYEQEGKEFPFDKEQGVSFSSAADGWGFRVYGGTSFNLFILKLDVTGMYDFVGENFGATVGARIQF